MRFRSVSLLCFLLLGSFMLSAKKVPPRPEKLVNDYAGVLQADENQRLEKMLRDWDDSTSTQIAVVIDPSLEGADLWTYVHELFNTWGIGQAKHNNGVLIYIALKEKRIRIHTGRGAEQFLGDIRSSHIIRDVLAPAMASGEYYTGINNTCLRIMALSRGEYAREKSSGGGVPPFVIFLVFLLIIFGLSFINRNKEISRRGARDMWGGGGWHFPTNRRGSGWGGGGGGFGGGGWGGFGGGSSGGGGASGGW
jgi:uncharacterized protein